MPDIDPAALSRSDSVTIANPSSLSLKQVDGVAALPSQKTPKTVTSAQRIDLEPLYTSLKAAIGDNWGTYKDALSLFILGKFHRCGMPQSECISIEKCLLACFPSRSS